MEQPAWNHRIPSLLKMLLPLKSFQNPGTVFLADQIYEMPLRILFPGSLSSTYTHYSLFKLTNNVQVVFNQFLARLHHHYCTMVNNKSYRRDEKPVFFNESALKLSVTHNCHVLITVTMYEICDARFAQKFCYSHSNVEIKVTSNFCLISHLAST